MKFHSDQLVQVKRAIAVDVVPSAKTEVGMCDGAQHSADENGSIRKPGGEGGKQKQRMEGGATRVWGLSQVSGPHRE